MAHRITSKGQVTIPLKIRQRHGFVAGSSVDLQEIDGRVVVVKAQAATRPRRAGKVALDALIEARKYWRSPFGSSDDHLAAMRPAARAD